MDSRLRESPRMESPCCPFLPSLTVRLSRTKQYKTKLKNWGFEKNVSSKDMQDIVRIDLKRKAEDPSKATMFRLRKRRVSPTKVERYKRDHAISDATANLDAGKSLKVIA